MGNNKYKHRPKKDWKKVKRIAKRQTEMREHYEDLFDTAVCELRFKNMLVDSLYSNLDEIETLCEKGVNRKLIAQIIKNQKERHQLDKLIHYNLINT